MPEEVREPIIQMVGINKYFGGVQAVNNVDLTVYPGEVLAVLGDNGAGKTTLVKCLSGAHSADGGEIYFKGKKVKIAITAPDALVQYSDIKQDTFSLNGFMAAWAKAQEMCKGGVLE